MQATRRLSREVRKRFAVRIAGAAVFGIGMSFMAAVHYTSAAMNSGSGPASDSLPGVNALLVKDSLDAEGFPTPPAWNNAPPISFDGDWRGSNSDSQRATEVRVLWNPETLFLEFRCRFRELNVFSDARADGWRDELWNKDVAEAFLQPDDRDPLIYKELEVSPNGFWIDLNISHGKREEMRSGLRRRVAQDAKAKIWTAELAVPMRSLTLAFAPAKPWRVNFYRVEGMREPRFYGAWSPTMSEKPNFHVPAAFGHLIFREQM